MEDFFIQNHIENMHFYRKYSIYTNDTNKSKDIKASKYLLIEGTQLTLKISMIKWIVGKNMLLDWW